MKNQPKKTNIEELRAKADAAVATWRAAEAASREATAAWTQLAGSQPGVRGQDSQVALKKTLAEKRHYEAEGEARVAAANAGRAVDELEAAEGDELARSIAPGHLASALAEDAAEETRLRAELAAVVARRVQRITSTEKNMAALTARRAASDLPPPAILPRLERALGGAERSTTEWASAFAEAAASPPKPRPTNTERLRQLANEERDMRLALEREHRAMEKAAQERREAEARHEQNAKEQRAREARERAEWAAKVQAEQAEQDELIAAQIARTGG